MTGLGTLPGVLAPGVTALALVAGVVALAATRRPAVALGVLLDLLLAAGLLRLAAEPTWTSLATAAAVVLLRRLIGAGLRAGGRALSAASVARPARDRWRPAA
ncbi:hypothetical protein JOD57_002538 [Geodermatophilus bullaregiensis]|uniref:DUF1622 domain-containing protein n=1 Tax=Geodermatophilus bullaregiensis TaxID=1564160 RepID=UPI00195603E7|nr:DUF1622 domain-containing protein [Geodermatophilus bullaregiensis]MBM7806701.1 hypothetical protein [Geodermatophilus bullaregiensis]